MFLKSVPIFAVFVVASVAQSFAWADLRFLERSFNAGEVKSGSPLSHRFRFVNDGPEPVEITDLRASCGCLTPKVPQRTYHSGEEGWVQLDVNTLSQPPGANTWRVQVGYRAGGTAAQTSLELTAQVLIEISVTPAAMTVFADSAISHEIVLADRREKPLSIVEVRASSPKLKAQVTEQFRDVLARWIRKVRVEVTGDCPDGRHEETLTLHTDDSSYRELRVPITIVQRPRQRVIAALTQVSLQVPAGQAAPSKIVLIRDSENQPVVVENVRADDPAVVIHFAQGPANMATVKISVDRTRLQKGTFRSAVHVEVREPLRQTLTIPVNCTVD